MSISAGGWQPPKLAGDDLLEEGELNVAPGSYVPPTHEAESASSAADGVDGGVEDGADGAEDAGGVDGEGDAEGGLDGGFAGDNDTLLYAVPKGGKQGMHCSSVCALLL